MLIGGYKYSEDVKPVCADPRLKGTRLALHNYGFWHTDWTSVDQWKADFKSRIGDCASRTILDEFGASMTTGLDYNGPVGTSSEVAYIQAATDTIRELGLGSVYWPGLRNGDTYSLTTLQGTGTNLSLTVNNQSGLDRLHWAWKQYGVLQRITMVTLPGPAPLVSRTRKGAVRTPKASSPRASPRLPGQRPARRSDGVGWSSPAPHPHRSSCTRRTGRPSTRSRSCRSTAWT